jgi:hypothetical protein
MDNEFILRWLTEFGDREAKPTDMDNVGLGDFSWGKALTDGYLIRTSHANRVTYRLTQKAINKLTKE